MYHGTMSTRTALRYVLVLLAGVALGALLASVLVARHYNRMLDSRFLMGVHEQAYLAHALRSPEMQPQAVASIEENFPTYAHRLEQGVDRETALPALWALEEYYDVHGLTPPSDLAELFADLPPHPPRSCLRVPAPDAG